MDKQTNDILKFSINNVLISAYRSNKKILQSCIAENDYLQKNIPPEIVDEYDSIKNGSCIEYRPADELSLEQAKLKLKANNFGEGLWDLAQLRKQNPDDISLIKQIIKALGSVKEYEYIIKYYKKFIDKYKDEDEELYEILSTAYISTNKFKRALPMVEKLAKNHENDTKHSHFMYQLAYLYERLYQDKYLDKQIEFTKQAFGLNRNENDINASLANLYVRNGEPEKAEECYQKILSNNPTPINKVTYGRYLIKQGNLIDGYGYYRERFKVGEVTYPQVLLNDPRWDGTTDLSDSEVIVHYEQGFGDSIMFARYIPKLSKLAKKVIFVVQKNWLPLLKSSGFEEYCQLLSHEADINLKIDLDNHNSSVMYSKGAGMSRIPHDWQIPMMDLPYLLKETPDNMTLPEGYVCANPTKVEQYRKKYIKNNNKFKIGFAYHGNPKSDSVYRDIKAKQLIPLFELENTEFYSFQADKHSKELDEIDKKYKIKDLSHTFNDFEATACALSCMDLVISTDNVIMNLAGALGIKTFAMFNVYTDARWFKTQGDDIGWYTSVKPFQAKTFNDWAGVINDIKTELQKEILAKNK